jgi:predicted RNase H-like nuclease (RuvC/YqgF family)
MSEREQIRQRAVGAVVRNALLSWQVAFTLVITVLLYFLVPEPFAFWQDWFWLILGGLTAGAFVVSTVTDPQAAQEAITRQFESQYDLRAIRNSVSRSRLQDALEYRRNMVTLAKRARGALRTNLLQTVDDVNDWIAHMYSLAQHIDAFEGNELVERDRRMVPQQLEKTRIRMERERDPEVRRDLERQVHQLEQQLSNLEATVNSVRRAEIQLESTLSSLGTVYAQMSRLGAKEVDSSRAQRLRLEIQDEVSGLQDTIEAMDEVQAQSLRLR